MFLADAHCDTITKVMRRGEELLDNGCHISINRLSAFESPVIFFAIFLNKEVHSKLFDKASDVYGFLTAQAEKYGDKMAVTKNLDEIHKAMAEGKLCAVPAIEGGEILEGSMENFYKVQKWGVKYITLTWNYPNEIGEPSAQNGAGLTQFGKDLVKEMNAHDVLADVSHLSEKGFWDVYELSSKPFIASHSNSKALCGHTRNLTDDQLRALGEKGGVTGLNFCPPFICGDGKATIDDACRHVDHMLKLAGEDSVGLGTDFDGISSTPEGLEDASKLEGLYGVFEKRYGEALTKKIFFENFMRVLK